MILIRASYSQSALPVGFFAGTTGAARAFPPLAGRLRHRWFDRGARLSPMNELAMNLATGRVDNRYLKVLIVGKAIFVKALCEGSAMCNRVGIRLEFDSDPISERNAVYHVKEKSLHSRQPWFVLFASQFLFLNNMRSDTAICRC
jgi:hypothetical protein